MRISVYIAIFSLFGLFDSFPVRANYPDLHHFSISEKSPVQSQLAEFLRINEGHLVSQGGNFQKEFSSFVEKMRSKKSKYKHELIFLRHLFYKVHRKYLHHYRTPVSMYELFERRSYDCLTGTAFYALLFEALDLDYQIIETTYHLYLTVNVDGQQVLIESTNPLQGFVTDPVEIHRLTEAFVNESPDDSGSDHYQFQQPVREVIDLTELSGLQYYNLALSSYNQKNLESALTLMEQALLRYSSDRLYETMSLMLTTLKGESAIDPFFKDYYLAKYSFLFSGEMVSRQP